MQIYLTQFFSIHLVLIEICFFPVIFFIKGLFFVVLCGSFFDFFLILHDWYDVLKGFAIFFINWIYFRCFVFYPIRKIYMWSTTIHIMFYDIYNTIKQHNQKQTNNSLIFSIQFHVFKKWFRKFFHNFICFIINVIKLSCFPFPNAFHALHHYHLQKKKN